MPRLHAALLKLSSESARSEALLLLTQAHRQIVDLLRAMPAATAPEVARLGLIGALRRTVDDEWGHAFDGVTWEIEAEAERQAQTLPPLTAEVLYYAAREAVRNAARHGRGADRPLRLHVAALWQGGLKILIEDDGVGLESATQSTEGSGHGLALHSTMLAVVGGALAVESRAETCTRVSLRLPQGAW